MRDRALIDVDGVLVDFYRGSRPILEKIAGRALTDDDFLRWDITACLPDQSMKEEFGRIVDSPGFCASLPLIPGSVEGIESLHRNGFEVVYVTSNRMDSVPWVHERDRWLMKHFGAKQTEIVHCHRKELVAGSFLVDDRPKNVEAWALHHPGPAFLWDQPYNRYAEQEHAGFRRVRSWTEVLQVVRPAPSTSQGLRPCKACLAEPDEDGDIDHHKSCGNRGW